MTDEAILPGKYITRLGYVAVILCNDAPGTFPLIGYLVDPNENCVEPMCWAQDGSISGTEHEAYNDLIGKVTPL